MLAWFLPTLFMAAGMEIGVIRRLNGMFFLFLHSGLELSCVNAPFFHVRLNNRLICRSRGALGSRKSRPHWFHLVTTKTNSDYYLLFRRTEYKQVYTFRLLGADCARRSLVGFFLLFFGTELFGLGGRLGK